MKIKGDELALFIAEAWPDPRWYWDHELFGQNPDPEAVYETSDIEGLSWDGRTEDNPSPTGRLDLDTLIIAWRASRSYDVVTLRVPRKGADPAHLPPRDPDAIAAAATLLLSDSTALDQISIAIASHRDKSPRLVARVGLAFAADPSGDTVPDELRNPGTPDERTIFHGDRDEAEAYALAKLLADGKAWVSGMAEWREDQPPTFSKGDWRSLKASMASLTNALEVLSARARPVPDATMEPG